jgi:antitoxin (DNA-binding transcriptional repressor) of toxin-antitoxin stability system
MKPVSVSYAKNNLSALLRRVREGQTVTITDRGVPVATLGAPPSTAGIPPRFIEMAQRGILKLPEVQPSAKFFRGPLPRPVDPTRNDAVEAVIEERRTGW